MGDKVQKQAAERHKNEYAQVDNLPLNLGGLSVGRSWSAAGK